MGHKELHIDREKTDLAHRQMAVYKDKRKNMYCRILF